MAQRFSLIAVLTLVLCFLPGCFTWSTGFERVSYGQLAKPGRITASYEVGDVGVASAQYWAERVRHVFRLSRLFSAVTEGSGSSDVHFVFVPDTTSTHWGFDHSSSGGFPLLAVITFLFPGGETYEELLTVEVKRRGASKHKYSYTGNRTSRLWLPLIVFFPYELLCFWIYGSVADRVTDAMILRALYDAQKDGLLR